MQYQNLKKEFYIENLQGKEQFKNSLGWKSKI